MVRHVPLWKADKKLNGTAQCRQQAQHYKTRPLQCPTQRAAIDIHDRGKRSLGDAVQPAMPIFSRAMGTRARFSATSVDQLPQMLAALQMFGHQLLLPIPDVDSTQYFLMLGAIRESHGAALAVEDAAMLEAVKELAETEGIVTSPEGGATLAALKRLLADGLLAGYETVVLFLTASGYKYLEVLKTLDLNRSH